MESPMSPSHAVVNPFGPSYVKRGPLTSANLNILMSKIEKARPFNPDRFELKSESSGKTLSSDCSEMLEWQFSIMEKHKAAAAERAKNRPKPWYVRHQMSKVEPAGDWVGIQHPDLDGILGPPVSRPVRRSLRMTMKRVHEERARQDAALKEAIRLYFPRPPQSPASVVNGQPKSEPKRKITRNRELRLKPGPTQTSKSTKGRKRHR